MQFEKSDTFYMVSAVNINWPEFTVEGIFFDQQKAKNFAAQLRESVDYVSESVSIEKLPLRTIVNNMVNERLTEISTTLSDRIREF